MGIRIKKALGYACDSFAAPVDFDTKLQLAHRTTLTEFIEWMKKSKDDILAGYADERLKTVRESDLRVIISNRVYTRLELDRCTVGSIVHIDRECGLPNVICMQPIDAQDWFRWDDPIDYYQAGSIEPTLLKLSSGIFPYLKGKPPVEVRALCMWLNVPEIEARVEESIYTWWS